MKQYEAATKYNAHTQAVRKWVKRFKKEGETGLEERSPCPHTYPNAAPQEKAEEIVTMRKEGKVIGDQIARELNLLQRIVSRHLIQAQLPRQKDIEPQV